MYKTQIEKFVVGDNIATSVVVEKDCGDSHYALLRISLFGKDSYAVCALGDGYALETVGEDVKSAQQIFELIAKAAASPIHLFDIVTDFRRETEGLD